MLKFCVIAGLLSVAVGSSLERRDLPSLDQYAMKDPDETARYEPAHLDLQYLQIPFKAFIAPFREAVLHMVAVGWNHTITDSAKLKVDMQQCSDTIKTSVANCKVCATKECSQHAAQVSHSPTFSDYLQFAASIANPYTFLKEPLSEVGDRLGDLVDLLGDGSDSFIDSMSSLGKTVGSGFTSAFHGLESGLSKVGDGLSTGVGAIVNVGNVAVNGVKDAASSVGHAVSHAAHSIIHHIGHIFGRRDLTPELRHCMEECSSCQALLITDPRRMVKTVCGEEVVKFNDTVRANVRLIKGIFINVSDKQHPVVAKLEYDPASANGLTYRRTYVTAMIKGRYVRYQSAVTYDMMNVATTARDMAVEYWRKWSE